MIFGDMPKGLPPKRDHDHAIQLVLGSQPPNIRPYRHTQIQKSEIEFLFEEMLEVGIIRHIKVLTPHLLCWCVRKMKLGRCV